MLLRFFFAVCTAVFLIAFTAPARAAQPALFLGDVQEHSLRTELSILPDVDARWTLDDFPRLRHDSTELLRNGTDFKSMPPETTRYWLIFDVTNHSDIEQWVIFIPMPQIDSLELIAVDAQGTRQYARSGENFPAYTQPFSDFGNSLPLTLQRDQPYQVAILIHDTLLPTLAINELSLMDLERYKQVSFRLSALIITSLATMIVLSILMLLLFWRIKDPTYGWYGLFALTTFLLWSTNYEFLRLLFAPDRNFYLLNYLSMAAMLYCTARLTRSFLRLHLHAPLIDRIYRYYNRALLAWMAVLVFVADSISYTTSAVFALLGLPILMAALFVTMRAGFQPARIYLLAWIFYFSSGGLTALDAIGLEQSTTALRLFTVVSTAIGLVIMAYSVVQRMEQLRSEKEKAEQRVRKDVLTGLLNRAAFEMDRKRLKDAYENKEIDNLFVVFIDLDGLKKLNDTRGHHYGDRLLIEFANQLTTTFDDYEFVYRLGGDEFLLLLPDNAIAEDPTWLPTRFEQLLKQLHNAGFPGSDCSYGSSSLLETNGNFKLANRLADERMYSQKKSKQADQHALPQTA